MKRVNVVLVIALAMATAPAAIAQQGQGTGSGSGQSAGQGSGNAVTTTGQQQGRTSNAPVCRDAKGLPYSQGALVRVADGSIERCDGGKWRPALPSETGVEVQASGRGNRGLGTDGSRNVRLDITINDQSVGGPPAKKTVSLLVADGFDGRVRSTGTITQEFVLQGQLTPEGKPLVSVRPVAEVQLNIDAAVSVVEQDRVRTRLTVEYTPGASEPLPAGSAVTRSPLNQSVTVILTNGKPMVITQAADPLSDRKITVEVTATILR